jgi:hypothetical protein
MAEGLTRTVGRGCSKFETRSHDGEKANETTWFEPTGDTRI